MQNEKQKQQKMEEASAVERISGKYILIFSLAVMAAAPLVISLPLHALSLYLDTDLSVLYPSVGMTVLQWSVYYCIMLIDCILQYACFGILGYSVMRYGITKSLAPIILSVIYATITYLTGIGETIYASGMQMIKNNLAYLGSYWIINYFLAIFTTLCIIFLCAMLRSAFRHRGRLDVSITPEEKNARKKNALRKLYFFITLLLLAFKCIPGFINMIMEIRKAGAPEDIWDLISLVLPLAESAIYCAVGYFVMLFVGSFLTKKERLVRKNQKESSTAS